MTGKQALQGHEPAPRNRRNIAGCIAAASLNSMESVAKARQPPKAPAPTEPETDKEDVFLYSLFDMEERRCHRTISKEGEREMLARSTYIKVAAMAAFYSVWLMT
ncbi:MAG: hypothetical protein P8Z31_07655, partial [Gammaproteobacteria bacterium]